MNISSIQYVKGIVDVEGEALLLDDTPQIAFIGRSNVGKSSLINVLTNSTIARTSSFPGRTQEINLFLANESMYFIDLPGYGFARVHGLGRTKIGKLIESYLFSESFDPKVIVLIINGDIGMTDKDTEMFEKLKHSGKKFIIALSKIDKLNQSEFHHRMIDIKEQVEPYPVFPFSSKKYKGLTEILNTITE